MATVRLDRVELENFKSYSGRTVVGPLRGFTAVVGPNGVGKSNLMDAISFVVGIKTHTLRGQRLEDLAYRAPGEDAEARRRRTCQVALVLTLDGEEVVFSRRLATSGSSEYRIDGRAVGFDEYRAELDALGLRSSARSNFLVFQNEVEGIANQSPKQLTGWFEQVSGSAELRDEYERTRDEYRQAEENVMFVFKKRRGLGSERRQYREQREEAEKFNELSERLARSRTDLAVYRLHHVEKDLQALQRELAAELEQMESVKARTSDVEARVEGGRRELARVNREATLAGRRLERAQTLRKRDKPEEVRVRTQLARARSRTTAHQQVLEGARADRERHLADLEALQASRRDLGDALATVRGELERAEGASVPGASVEEYRRLQEESEAQSSALQREATASRRAVRLAEQRQAALEARDAELATRLRDAAGEIAELERAIAGLRDGAERAERAVAEQEGDLAGVQRGIAERVQRRQELEQEAGAALESLREATATTVEDARERRFGEALVSMKRMFPGVKGVLSELCRPTQRRYRDAVSLVFGRLMDAIVVDTSSTGEECITYLKQQRVGKATFLPLADLRPAPVDESLRRGVGGTARLVIDVLSFRSEDAAAVQYAAGSAIICDTLDEARRIRYGPPAHRVKVCSLDGSLIGASGFITGGASGDDAARLRKWDRAELDQLRRRRADAQAALQALPAGTEERAAEAEAAQRASDARRSAEQARLDLRGAEERLARAAGSHAEVAAQSQSLAAELASGAEELAARRADLDRAQAAVDGVRDQVFGDFAERAGAASIREFEQDVLQRVEALQTRRLELEQQLAKVESHVEYVSAKDVDEVVRAAEAEAALLRERVEQLEEEERRAREGRARNEESIGELEAAVATATSAAEALQAEQAARRAELESLSADFNARRKTVAAVEARVEATLGSRGELLRRYRIEQVQVPFIRDDGSRRGQPAADVVPDERGHLPRDVRLDVSGLNRRQREASSPDARAELERSLSDALASLEGELQKLAPNLRAQEHVTDLEHRIEELNREYEQARERATAASEAHEKVRAERKQAFDRCFNGVAGRINEIYQDLTRTPAHPMGGTAYLSVESPEEPYLGGLIYNAMPPNKRLMGMDQLSGGERTVAAIALLFGVYDFQPSPFFVLDEVDASLDNRNLGRVSGYIRRRAPHVQTIVISLKENFFEQADALVGVHRHVPTSTSRVTTLELIDLDADPPSAVALPSIPTH